jgi:hypothetical protein
MSSEGVRRGETDIRVLIASTACLVAATLGLPVPAGAAASFASEDPWAAEHIGKLPPDLRREVSRRGRACGSGALAGHYFAVSIEGGGRRFVSLHFEDFSCGDRAQVCRGDACLHEIFVESGGRYRVVFSRYAKDVRMTNDQGAVGLEVLHGGTLQTWRWNGRGFVPPTNRNGH